jgi:hypothetical protein
MEKPVLTWNSEDVATWLDCIGLSNYKEHFLGKFFLRRLDDFTTTHRFYFWFFTFVFSIYKTFFLLYIAQKVSGKTLLNLSYETLGKVMMLIAIILSPFMG